MSLCCSLIVQKLYNASSLYDFALIPFYFSYVQIYPKEYIQTGGQYCE